MNVLCLDGPRKGQLIRLTGAASRRCCFQVHEAPKMRVRDIDESIADVRAASAKSVTYFIKRMDEQIGFASVSLDPSWEMMSKALFEIAKTQAERIKTLTEEIKGLKDGSIPIGW